MNVIVTDLTVDPNATDSPPRFYGGIEGPDAAYVELISADGHSFIIRKDHAFTSGTITAILSGPDQFAEHEPNQIQFKEIESHVLHKICSYFQYKINFTNCTSNIPEFPIEPEIAIDLLMAANFLDC
ncbi:elongin-C-like [Teleopsis dalmanni]|uniref:elongin-C-like n=1 Tax=Teleopsis dalmanni TaxID=139649 RepID=UPI0018CF4F4B|nr:elongin-C-like [Teleopsis dalmanni]XP_037960331.1 elongin-C-like [Teleopsis dalmanni]